jgi:hypothetical protein
MSPIQSVEIRIPDRDVCWLSNTDPRFSFYISAVCVSALCVSAISAEGRLRSLTPVR